MITISFLLLPAVVQQPPTPGRAATVVPSREDVRAALARWWEAIDTIEVDYDRLTPSNDADPQVVYQQYHLAKAPGGKYSTKAEHLLLFQLTLVGDSKPPFITSSTGVAQLGEVFGKDGHAELSIDTRETTGSTPWIDRVVSDLPGLRASGGVEFARLFSAGVVWRRYHYDLAFDQPPASGEILGKLHFLASGGDETALILPIRGRVLPSVYVRPSRLHARYNESEGPPRLRFSVVAADPETELDAKPDGLVGDPFEIELKSRTRSRLEFVLTPRSTTQPNVDVEVSLETNQTGATRVTIPVTFRRDPK